MNKYPAISRLTLLLNYIKGTHKTKKQIISYFEDHEIIISNKTLERDLNFLKDWGYELTYSPKGYIIDKQCGFENELFRRFNELFKIKEIIDKESEFLDYVLDTSTEMIGIELLPELFSAFKLKRIVTFKYRKFDNDEESTRTLLPLWLKEHEERWYLIGVEEEKTEIRIFGLDRIKDLKLLETYNQELITADIVKQIDNLKYMIGITRPTFGTLKREFIELGVSDYLLKYWKSKPIHVTQHITNKKIENFTIVEFTLIPNITFIKLIVSGLGKIKLISPKSLKKNIKDEYGQLIKTILE
jgi:predicted DNA-binding transcriptional regulator YafY